MGNTISSLTFEANTSRDFLPMSIHNGAKSHRSKTMTKRRKISHFMHSLPELDQAPRTKFVISGFRNHQKKLSI